MKISSFGDEIEIVGDVVVIRKRGVANAMASGTNGDRSIPVRSITAIGFKAGGTFSPGFIQFSYAGSKAFRGGLIEATQDPDAFVFNKVSNVEVEAFRAAVEGLRSEPEQQTVPETRDGLAGQLERLATLHRQGLLSDDEFRQAKARLISDTA